MSEPRRPHYPFVALAPSFFVAAGCEAPDDDLAEDSDGDDEEFRIVDPTPVDPTSGAATVTFRDNPNQGGNSNPQRGGVGTHHPGYNPSSTADQVENDTAVITLDSDASTYVPTLAVAASKPSPSTITFTRAIAAPRRSSATASQALACMRRGAIVRRTHGRGGETAEMVGHARDFGGQSGERPQPVGAIERVASSV